MLVLAAAFGLGVPAGARAATTLGSCTDAAFRQAVAAGGIVLFGVDCPNLVLVRPVAVPAGLSVDIRANGHVAILDGGSAVRHFVVTGGTLSITGLTLRNGRAAGASGADGLGGSTPSSGDGGPGRPGLAGGTARGGAIRIDTGTVTLRSVTLSGNRATGGAGGKGGAGAAGSPAGPSGAGGAGGRGGPGGSAEGGAIWNGGTLRVFGSTFSNNVAQGGAGGAGGLGGNGADGDAGAPGTTSTDPDGHGNPGGAGEAGGAGGAMGSGGAGGAGSGGGDLQREVAEGRHVDLPVEPRLGRQGR